MKPPDGVDEEEIESLDNVQESLRRVVIDHSVAIKNKVIQLSLFQWIERNKTN